MGVTKRYGPLILVFLLALGGWGPSLYADKNSQFGVLWGLSVPDADNTNSFHIFGVKGSSFFSPVLSVGGYYLLSDHVGEVSSLNKFRYSLTGIEGAYHVPAATGDTFIAVRMGISKVQETPNGVDTTFSPYHYGIASGYDYYLTTVLTLGFEGSYLHCLPNRTTVNGVDINMNSFNIISFLVSVQLRL